MKKNIIVLISQFWRGLIYFLKKVWFINVFFTVRLIPSQEVNSVKTTDSLFLFCTHITRRVSERKWREQFYTNSEFSFLLSSPMCILRPFAIHISLQVLFKKPNNPVELFSSSMKTFIGIINWLEPHTCLPNN